MQKSIRQILNIMEDMPMAGTTSVLSGGSAAQDAQEVGMDIMPSDYAPDGYEQEEEECGDCPISSELLDLAQELIARAGGPDKARDIIDKVQDVQEVLNVDDASAIAGMAEQMPEDSDLPTNNRHDELGMSAMYDPGGDM